MFLYRGLIHKKTVTLIALDIFYDGEMTPAGRDYFDLDLGEYYRTHILVLYMSFHFINRFTS